MHVCMYIVWLQKEIVPVLNSLRADGVKFAGVCMDNEHTSNALFDELQTSFDFLLHIPCAAHIIQLVVKQLFNHATVKPHLDKMIEIIREVLVHSSMHPSIHPLIHS
jgi:hypothetical protein